ncbi:NADP-dependent oxidoreductase domain-containing protein [Aspergillus bertholletiae]|uniref:NADP-dependent oxidoreductase domain-containing protein n=1 Tax=Aspergillus bertholletiae TaxID=1226010 RepID=A0A5N7BLS6_9EURO|nr:NADP-dependent oxidoreductase domain-containing protein [Aspergillus bertholletiae]
MTISKTFASLAEAHEQLPPPVESRNLLEQIDQQIDELPILVVLDGDPTGTRTCRGINVLTAWDNTTLVEEFRTCHRGFVIFMDSYQLNSAVALRLISEICTAVKRAAAEAERNFEIVLRHDSPLGSHFPDALQVVEETVDNVDGWILAPRFRSDGLSASIRDICRDDGTPDHTSSDMIDNMVQSNGSIPRHRVRSISLQDIREGGVSAVAKWLLECDPGCIIIVDAMVDTDMEIFVLGLIQAKSAGRSYLYSTEASFVSTRLAIGPTFRLTAQELGLATQTSSGGLIVGGPCVYEQTSLQRIIPGLGLNLKLITLMADDLLRGTESSYTTVLTAADEASKYIVDGYDVLLVASNDSGGGCDGVSSSEIATAVSAAFILFLRLVTPRPRYIITNPGFPPLNRVTGTSLDIARTGLRIRRARIMGETPAGQPVWCCDEPSSKFFDIPYVMFYRTDRHIEDLLELIVSWESRNFKRRPKMGYQRLGNSGLKVSKIILGCMTFGNPSWEGSPWVLPEGEALPLLKKAYDCGINTWDTANTYSNGISEILIGKALEKYEIPRSKVVIMTKLYYPVLDVESSARPNPAVNDGDLVNQMGLSRKHIFEAVEASLTRLKSKYIDVLQLHRIDDTPPEEVMRALHDLVQTGKVHYLGASSMYCWQLARLQYAAKINNWTTFTSMQGLYNLLYREEERETNQFCQAEGIGLVPWSPLARGLLARPWNVKTDRSTKDAKTAKWFSGNQDEKIVTRVQQLAQSKGCSMSALAIAWLLKKGACPIVGLNSMERIESASQALAVRLDDADMRFLEEQYRPLAVQAI